MNLETYRKQQHISKDELFIRQMVKATKEHAAQHNKSLLYAFNHVCEHVRAPYWNKIQQRLFNY